jgi:hypothetical protein
MVTKLTGYTAMIYNAEGEELAESKIWEHDLVINSIELSDLPELAEEEVYDLLIPMAPMPYICKGKVQIRNGIKHMLLFKVKASDSRKETRFNVNVAAEIEHLLYGNQAYPTYHPVEVYLKNLSKNGLCFRAVKNTLSVGDSISLRLLMNDHSNKLLTAHVMRCRDVDDYVSEYGCRLVKKKKS